MPTIIAEIRRCRRASNVIALLRDASLVCKRRLLASWCRRAFGWPSAGAWDGKLALRVAMVLRVVTKATRLDGEPLIEKPAKCTCSCAVSRSVGTRQSHRHPPHDDGSRWTRGYSPLASGS